MPRSKNLLILLPIAGIITFIILFIISASQYPGGSSTDIKQKGYNIIHNYWCDLLSDKAINGDVNNAMSLAVSGMFILCSSLILFWFYLPRLFKQRSVNQRIIQFAGIASMITGMFLFTSFHNEVILISGFCSCCAFIATLLELKKAGKTVLFISGIVCLAMGIITFIIYQTGKLFNILPVVQKVTMMICLIWVAVLSLRTYKSDKRQLLSKSSSTLAGLKST